MSDSPGISALRALRDHIRDTCGIYLAEEKIPRLDSVVATRMTELGIESFDEYQGILSSAARGRDESAALAALLTVGETHFFRNKDHWRAFEECVLPWVVERNATTRRIRIWSAGCSTGEEAYNAGIVLSRNVPNLAEWSIEITGSDLSPESIATARSAVYTDHSFRGVSAADKKDYFDLISPGRYRVRDDIRDMVRFQEMNLLDSAATAKLSDIDVIFCRNVLYYFDESGAERAMANFHRCLRTDGFLFLGHAESTRGNVPGFACLNVGNTFLFKPVPGAVRAEAVPKGPIAVAAPVRVQPRVSTPKKSEHPVGPPAGRRTEHTAVAELAAPVESVVPCDAPPPLGVLRVQAMESLCAEDHFGARRLFQEILEREPGDIGSLLGMALLVAGSGTGEEALQYCERVLESQPMSAEAYCVMALVHEGLGEDAIVQRELEKAIYLDEGFSMAHFRLAGLNDRAERHEAATRGFKNVLETLPSDDEQRVRLYSGGFSKESVAQVCERRLGIESPAPRSEGRSR